MLRRVCLTPAVSYQRVLGACVQQTRNHSGRPWNTGILFVKQQEAWVVERFGKYLKILQPGLNFLIPFIDEIRHVQVLKEIAIEVPEQHAITADNVTLALDGVLYVKVRDPYKASYGVEDPEFAITQLAQTTMRSELGKISLDHVFKERESLNLHIVNAINNAAEAWGIVCLRYEIRDIKLPAKVQEAMQMQVYAERKKRAAILESEGQREADINVAEGKKKARILNSEAYQLEQVNKATGEAEAIIAKARAQASAVSLVAEALNQENGMNAVSMKIAEEYVSAFGNLAKEGNTVLLPANAGDVSGMVAQAMSIYSTLSAENKGRQITISKSPDNSVNKELPNLNVNTPLSSVMENDFSDTTLKSTNLEEGFKSDPQKK